MILLTQKKVKNGHSGLYTPSWPSFSPLLRPKLRTCSDVCTLSLGFLISPKDDSIPSWPRQNFPGANCGKQPGMQSLSPLPRAESLSHSMTILTQRQGRRFSAAIGSSITLPSRTNPGIRGLKTLLPLACWLRPKADGLASLWLTGSITPKRKSKNKRSEWARTSSPFRPSSIRPLICSPRSTTPTRTNTLRCRLLVRKQGLMGPCAKRVGGRHSSPFQASFQQQPL